METTAAAMESRDIGGGSPRRRWLAAPALLLALAGLMLLFRERAPAALGLERAADPFTYEQGTGQVFRAAGNGLAVLSSSSAELMDRNGKTVFKQVVSYENPALYASDTGALFCDIGGTGCLTADFEGNGRRLESPGNIRSAHRSREGYVALCTEEAGYKGRVTVYDPQGKPVFGWWSGTGYVLRACVSPDGQRLAVLCGVNGGGALHVFRLDQEQELAKAEFKGELPFDFCFLGNERLCTVSSTGLNFLDAEGGLLNRFDYGGHALVDYTLDGQDFVAVCVGDGSGGDNFLAAVDRDGRLWGNIALDQPVVSMSAAGRRLLLLFTGGMALYDRSLRAIYSDDSLLAVRTALLRADGDLFLLSAYSAEKLHVG